MQLLVLKMLAKSNIFVNLLDTLSELSAHVNEGKIASITNI